MKVNCNITPREKADLHNNWDYTLGIWGEAQADKYITTLFERFGWLSKQPYVTKHRLDIIGVPHRSMDIQSFFDD